MNKTIEVNDYVFYVKFPFTLFKVIEVVNPYIFRIEGDFYHIDHNQSLMVRVSDIEPIPADFFDSSTEQEDKVTKYLHNQERINKMVEEEERVRQVISYMVDYNLILEQSTPDTKVGDKKFG